MTISKIKKTKTIKKKTVKPKTKQQKTKVVCISHKEDADGISSAALIRQAFGGDSVLGDYPGQMEAIQKVCSDEKLKTLFICDLGLSKKNQDEFVELLRQLKKNRVAVTYIDHHDIDPKIV
ncbi:MAG: DHH family phosphoesterase, partial [Nitrosarchaeum sp.]